MRFYQKLIANRRKGGIVYEAKKRAFEWYQKYPDDEFAKQEYRYWQKVYWLTGKVTRRLEIDASHAKRKKALWERYFSENDLEKSLSIGELQLHLDEPSVCREIVLEYSDICEQDPYFKGIKLSSCQWYQQLEKVPSLQYQLLGEEGPYETEFVQLHKNDIVIDCGANMGIFSMLAVRRGAKTVYAFDPQERALRLLNANITSNNCEGKIIPVPYGLSDKKCTLSFVEDSISGSHITREGDTATTTIECTTLDDWVAENNIPRIDFIKADIEGAERDMLRGAKNTIKRDHPRLAICTYHLPDDPEVLRDIILSIDPSYHIDQRAMKLYAW